MVVSCGEGIWVCVGDSVRVVWYACRVYVRPYVYLLYRVCVSIRVCCV